MSFRVIIDRRDEKRMLARFTAEAVAEVMDEAAAFGAKEAAKVVKAKAPVGVSERPSAWYRLRGYGHRTLKNSVQAAAIGSPGRGMAGQVVGPMGDEGFARGFVAKRTGWPASAASLARTVAYRASDAVLTLYAKRS